jgi:hypothetical protein
MQTAVDYGSTDCCPFAAKRFYSGNSRSGFLTKYTRKNKYDVSLVPDQPHLLEDLLLGSNGMMVQFAGMLTNQPSWKEYIKALVFPSVSVQGLDPCLSYMRIVIINY